MIMIYLPDSQESYKGIYTKIDDKYHIIEGEHVVVIYYCFSAGECAV